MRIALILVPLLPLAACAQAFEGRVAARLTDAGLSRPMADCMAKRWVKRLSVIQLRRISALSDDLSRDKAEGRLTVIDFVERVRALHDPEILSVVSSTTAVCAIRA